MEREVFRQQASSPAVISVLLATLCRIGHAQNGAVDATDKHSFQFDIVSIHASAPADTYSQRLVNESHSGQFVATSFRMSQLIGRAFGVDYQSQVLDLPKEIQNRRFDINAKSDNATDLALRNLSDDQALHRKERMLQSLLIDRFHLRYRLESKQLSAYELRISAKGAKLRRHESKVGEDSGFRTARNDQGIEVDGQSVAIDNLPSVLSFYLKSSVVNRTGLAGTYDLTLKFKGTLTNTETTSNSEWPPLETAIQEQLGLKLFPTKLPTLVVIVEHIEMPTPN